jgi:hypothetical protein
MYKVFKCYCASKLVCASQQNSGQTVFFFFIFLFFLRKACSFSLIDFLGLSQLLIAYSFEQGIVRAGVSAINVLLSVLFGSDTVCVCVCVWGVCARARAPSCVHACMRVFVSNESGPLFRIAGLPMGDPRNGVSGRYGGHVPGFPASTHNLPFVPLTSA